MKTFYEWCIENNREDLLKQWHPTKNMDLKPENVSYGCNKKVWWMCEKGHEWEVRPVNRTKSGCPICSNKKILSGYNDLATTHPEIAKEWHPTKNGDLKPTSIVAGSTKKVWWQCEKGHEWQSIVKSRTKLNTGCPYCSNYKIQKGYNDLATTHPEIAKQWHPTKNGNLQPDEISIGTDKIIWWQCEHGHEWKCRTVDRKKAGCPICSNRQLLVGCNDLKTTHPEIAKEWHPTKNSNLKPTQISAGSHLKVWWQCKFGHEWEAKIENRTRQNQNCPICSNQRTLIGYNDLATTYPVVAKEWHPTKNGDLKPTDIVAGSTKEVWWQCKKGHEWKAPVQRRTIKNVGCPKCNESRRVSFPEKVIYYYIKQIFPNAYENYKLPYSHNLELDIFIEDINLGIEYDGSFYHKYHEKDVKKYELCKQYDISLIRIREKNCPKISNIGTVCYYLKENNNNDLNKAIEFIFEFISKNYSININNVIRFEKDLTQIYDLMEFLEEENSLAKKYPEIAKEWHPTRNGKLKPEYMSAGSNKKVWWKCEHGHEWQSTIYTRTCRKTKCPYCSNRKLLTGYNDLATINPELAEQWHPTKNGKLKPEYISVRSNKKVWWKCEHGHEWQARISDRKNLKCPYCSNRKLLTGYNDLATTHPEIVKEWHPTKNGDLKPTKISAGSHYTIWWKCNNCGYEYKKEVRRKVRKKDVCPNCKQ